MCTDGKINIVSGEVAFAAVAESYAVQFDEIAKVWREQVPTPSEPWDGDQEQL